MKRKLIFSLLILIAFQTQAQEKIGYFTPKKIFTVSVPYKITQTTVYEKDNKTIADRGVIVKLDGDINVESKLFPDKYFELDVSSLGKGGRSFSFEIGYDTSLTGILTTLNAKQEPITGDVIKGVVGLVSSGIKLVTGGLFGYAGTDEKSPTPKIEVVEQKLNVKKSIEIGSDGKDEEIIIKPELEANIENVLIGTIPTVKVTIKKTPATETLKAKDKVTLNTETPIFIKYMIPAEYALNVNVINDQFSATRDVINELVYIPQAGVLSTINVLVIKGKRQLQLAISPTTGALTKYSYVKESTLKSVFDSSVSGLDGLGAEIKALKAASLKDKEEEQKKLEEEKKKQAELAKDNTLSEEIEKLKLENTRLELLIKQRELQEQAKKKN